jgi:hypothetical protein
MTIIYSSLRALVALTCFIGINELAVPRLCAQYFTAASPGGQCVTSITVPASTAFNRECVVTGYLNVGGPLQEREQEYTHLRDVPFRAVSLGTMSFSLINPRQTVISMH